MIWNRTKKFIQTTCYKSVTYAYLILSSTEIPVKVIPRPSVIYIKVILASTDLSIGLISQSLIKNPAN